MLSGDEFVKNNTMRMPAVFILVGMVSVFAAGPAQAEPVFNSSITYIGAANDPNYHNWRLEVTNDSLEDYNTPQKLGA